LRVAVTYLGLTPLELLNFTPSELNTAIEGYKVRRQIADNDITTNAWLTAAFSRQKRLQKLEKFLHKFPSQKKKKSVEQARKEYYELLERFNQKGGEAHG